MMRANIVRKFKITNASGTTLIVITTSFDGDNITDLFKRYVIRNKVRDASKATIEELPVDEKDQKDHEYVYLKIIDETRKIRKKRGKDQVEYMPTDIFKNRKKALLHALVTKGDSSDMLKDSETLSRALYVKYRDNKKEAIRDISRAFKPVMPKLTHEDIAKIMKDYTDFMQKRHDKNEVKIDKESRLFPLNANYYSKAFYKMCARKKDLITLLGVGSHTYGYRSYNKSIPVDKYDFRLIVTEDNIAHVLARKDDDDDN